MKALLAQLGNLVFGYVPRPYPVGHAPPKPITDTEARQLWAIANDLERGRLKHVPWDLAGDSVQGETFNMAHWCYKGDCGTVSCIGGTFEFRHGYSLEDRHSETTASWPLAEKGLYQLFYQWSPEGQGASDPDGRQAAQAIRNYVLTGKPKWEEVY